MGDYEIRISLTPHPWDNKSEPYFWMIAKWSEGGKTWCNSGHCGWARTPKEAFKFAYESYIMFIEKEN